MRSKISMNARKNMLCHWPSKNIVLGKETAFNSLNYGQGVFIIRILLS